MAGLIGSAAGCGMAQLAPASTPPPCAPSGLATFLTLLTLTINCRKTELGYVLVRDGDALARRKGETDIND